MTILEKLIKEFDKDELSLQVKKICSIIHDEENEKCKHQERLPTGPNVFLSIEIPSVRNNEISYLSLEREGGTQYIVVLWGLNNKLYTDKSYNLKRKKTWEINENTAEKILIKFAKLVNSLKGN